MPSTQQCTAQLPSMPRRETYVCSEQTGYNFSASISAIEEGNEYCTEIVRVMLERYTTRLATER